MERDEGPGPVQQATTTLGLVVISFLVGSVVTDSGMFPYEPYLRQSFQALRVAVSNVVRLGVHDVGDIWQPARSQETGTIRHDPTRSFGGYTLFTSGHGNDAYLVDMKGDVVHEWNVPFEKAFPDPQHVSDPLGERITYLRRGHVFPNGDLLAIYEGYGDTPWGLGMVKVNADSEVVWTYAERTHHDLEVAADGTITTMIHDMRDVSADPLSAATPLSGEVVQDYVVRLTPDGQETLRINVLEALADSRYSAFLGQMKFDHFETWDPTHANDVSVITSEFAAHHAFTEAGHVMISLRTLDLLAILDLERADVVWAKRGPWVHQHDPDPLPNGRLLVFDNFGKTTAGGMSRVLEIDPVTTAVHWRFEGTESEPFESLTRSTQQPLPNGNLQIVESDGARILEVTRDGAIVWEFRNPKTRKDGAEVAIIADAQRVGPHELTFLE